MFPASYQTVGYIPASAQKSDPANDPQLLAETESHYWFQFNSGSGMQDADPLMPRAMIGGIFTTSSGTFSQVPDALRQTTEVKLQAEMYSQAGAIFAGLLGQSPLTTTTVLDKTFNDADLVGRPLSIGNFVTTSSFGALFLTRTTITYSPYIVVGDDALPDSQLPEAITGQPYQEVITNFPLGTQVLTGLFLDVTLTDPESTPHTYEHTILDRIGYATRHNGGAPGVNIDPNGPPILSALDITTVNVLGGLQNSNVIGLQTKRLSDLKAILNQIDSSDPKASRLASEFTIGESRLLSEAVATLSDVLTAELARAYTVAAYFARPRLILSSQQITQSGSGQTATVSHSIDLLQDMIRAFASTDQVANAPFNFNVARGFTENGVESGIIALANPTGTAVSTTQIFTQAIHQGISLITLSGAEDITRLDSFGLDLDATARISSALVAGHLVTVPSAPVVINGQPTTGWYETDPSTGYTTGVLPSGQHQGLIEWIGQLTRIQQTVLGLSIGLILGSFNGLAIQQVRDHYGTEAAKRLKVEEGIVVSTLATYFRQVYKPAVFVIIALAGAFALSTYIFNTLANIDPLTPSELVDLTIPQPMPSDVAQTTETSTATVAGGATSSNFKSTSFAAAGPFSATWASSSNSSFQISSFTATTATVTDATGHFVGSGAVNFKATAPVVGTIAGNDEYRLNGNGSLSFYGPAEASLGVSGDWSNYAASVAGSPTIKFTTDSLTLNNQSLPAGTYTIKTDFATLSGSGATSSPNFSGSVAITATNGVINLGPGTGNLVVGGKPLDPTNETTLTGYSGTINVTANGDGADAVSLDGNTGNVLQMTSSPITLTTDQNTPIMFATHVQTSFADTYTLTANAPVGWTVTIDASGNVTATPAPGLQGGTYPIQIIARSTTNPDLVAQSVVNVTITPTQPGLALNVAKDPIFTVPFNGALLPTAFRASIRNLGPADAMYNLTFSGLPAGFTLLNSGTTVTVPAGHTGILGLYLQPNLGQPIPPPGTQLTFTVTATSTTNAVLTKSQLVSFTVPAVDALTLTSSPTSVNTTPGSPATATITITNAGNVPENNITLAATTSSGLTVSGLMPLSLAVGQSATETVTLTPNAATPLNSTLDATISATYGPSLTPATQSLNLTVQVVVPGAAAIANAAVAAAQLGNSDLANRLNNLSTALTNLVQNPTGAVYRSQSLASLDAVNGLLTTDPYLESLIATLTADRATLAQAQSPGAIQAALAQLGTDLGTVGTTLTDEAAHGFNLSLLANSAIGQPQTPSTYGIVLQNTGTQTTTYDLGLSALPTGVTGAFNQPSITLMPGQSTLLAATFSDLSVSLISTSATELPSFNFTVRVIAEGATEFSRTTTGSFAARANFVQVLSVNTNPAFVDPGGQVEVTARLLNAVNRQQDALISYSVSDATGSVVFTSQPIAITLNVLSTLSTVDLGSLDTTGYALGQDTITVSVADSSGHPIQGASGIGSLLIGSPVSATLTTTPTTLPPGNGSSTTTLSIQGPVLTAMVTVPTNNGVTILPGSFNIPPTTIAHGINTDILTWDFTADLTTAYVTSVSPYGIQKVDLATNTVTTILETAGEPDSLIFDGSGDIIYTLISSGQVGLFNLSSGANLIIASGLGSPQDIALEPGGNSVLVSDFSNNRIERIDLNSHAITTLAANIFQPRGLTYDQSGHLFAVSSQSTSLLQIDPNSGSILKTIALQPKGIIDGITFDPVTGALWVADNGGGLIEVSNYLGSAQVHPEFSSPVGNNGFDGVESDGHGGIYCANFGQRIFKYDIGSNTFTSLTSVNIDDLAPVTGSGSSAGSSTTLTWQSSVSALQPGEVRTVAENASIQYAFPGTLPTSVDIGPYVNANIRTYANGGGLSDWGHRPHRRRGPVHTCQLPGGRERSDSDLERLADVTEFLRYPREHHRPSISLYADKFRLRPVRLSRRLDRVLRDRWSLREIRPGARDQHPRP